MNTDDLDILPDRPYLLDEESWEAYSRRRRNQVIEIAKGQWWLCYYCSLPINRITVSRDHLMPKSLGGNGCDENIVATCAGCNQKKGNNLSPPERYIRLRQRQYYREMGLRSTKPRREWAAIFPGFGTDLDGKPLMAPQIGIV